MKQGQLHPLSMGLALGLICGVSLFVLTLIAASNGYGASILTPIVGVYPFYELTTVGAFWGALWCFLDGFIGGLLISWLYNALVKKLKK